MSNSTIANLSQFRNSKAKDISPYIEEMEIHLKNITELRDDLIKTIREFTSTENVPHKVAETIMSEELTQIQSLSKIHKSMYKINDINDTLALDVIPKSTMMLLNCTQLHNGVKLEIMNDPIFSRITTSNAEREREVKFIMLKMDNIMESVKANSKMIKDLISHVDTMSSYINRLDSMIRLKDKIIQNSEFENMIGKNNGIMKMTLGG